MAERDWDAERTKTEELMVQLIREREAEKRALTAVEPPIEPAVETAVEETDDAVEKRTMKDEVAVTREDFGAGLKKQLEFTIPEEDLLSLEELEALERSQVFE
ncbi:hypothetical protein FRC17_001987 [Serendipita sp. 399]|nr:hypothetical protein FRC17_001987 [Serendipita sp. 399]